MRKAGCLTVLLLLTMTTLAKADTITFKLDEANIAFPGPYADVTINLVNPTTAQVLFESLGAAGNLYLFGGQGAVALNVDAASFTVTDFIGSNSGSGFIGVVSDLSQGAAGNEDGFGSFNLTVDNFDGYSHAWQSIGFTLTNTGGTWTNALDVLIGNNDNPAQVAAAHIFVCAMSPTFCDQSNGAIATGFASGFDSGPGGPPPPPPPPEPVPEPTTLVMLGSGLVLTASKLRRKYGQPK